jgi:hypothetical protein
VTIAMFQTSFMTNSTEPIAHNPEVARRWTDVQTRENLVAPTAMPQEPHAIAKAAARSVSRVAPWTPSARDRIEGFIAYSLIGAVMCVVCWIAFRLGVLCFDRILGMT